MKWKAGEPVSESARSEYAKLPAMRMEEYRWPLETGKGRETHSPLEPREVTKP